MALDFSIQPKIFIYLTNSDLEKSIPFLLYGIEEEGIPFEVKTTQHRDAVQAGYQAAKDSSLITGVGCDGQTLVLHYKNLEPEKPYLVIDRYQTKPNEHLKDFGSNCARLIKGIPLKSLEEMEVKE
ncbi:PduH protein [Enterococcus florum]|uniref:PduH protein n=1 Tax=Enterococcus florum TaxID=2480627 RepID=A0A4P5PHV8_9ENTE|nr:glycerol dehydratase reactivase beta/small subunit family protein [Enterococcus florum]GCF95232.1 PduH protein [Enterococcus florum]